MPATAGRTAMPRGNRMDTSASLRTTGIWANTIGYDPYAPTAEAPGAGAAPAENVYEKSKGLLAAARLTGGVEVDTGRGQWKGSGRLKGVHAPGRGMPDEPASAPVAAPVEAPAGEDSDSELSSDSESARRRQRKAAKADKKRHKHSRSKKHRRSDSGSERSSGSDERRRRKRSEDKREKKARKKARKERKASPSSSSD